MNWPRRMLKRLCTPMQFWRDVREKGLKVSNLLRAALICEVAIKHISDEQKKGTAR
jgi:hypothetical protein